MSEDIPRHRWRRYKTRQRGDPVKRFIEELPDFEAVELIAAMRVVRQKGLKAARHVKGDIYEVRASSADRTLRLLFASEGAHVFLALEAFVKKTQKTPPSKLRLAENRLQDWRARGRA